MESDFFNNIIYCEYIRILYLERNKNNQSIEIKLFKYFIEPSLL